MTPDRPTLLEALAWGDVFGGRGRALETGRGMAGSAVLRGRPGSRFSRSGQVSSAAPRGNAPGNSPADSRAAAPRRRRRRARTARGLGRRYGAQGRREVAGLWPLSASRGRASVVRHRLPRMDPPAPRHSFLALVHAELASAAQEDPRRTRAVAQEEPTRALRCRRWSGRTRPGAGGAPRGARPRGRAPRGSRGTDRGTSRR